MLLVRGGTSDHIPNGRLVVRPSTTVSRLAASRAQCSGPTLRPKGSTKLYSVSHSLSKKKKKIITALVTVASLRGHGDSMGVGQGRIVIVITVMDRKGGGKRNIIMHGDTVR